MNAPPEQEDAAGYECISNTQQWPGHKGHNKRASNIIAFVDPTYPGPYSRLIAQENAQYRHYDEYSRNLENLHDWSFMRICEAALDVYPCDCSRKALIY